MTRPTDNLPDWDERLDLAPIARAALWGGCAVLAAFAVVLSARSETGSQRISALIETMAGARSAPPPPETAASRDIAAVEDEMRQLADAVRTLTTERERLTARLDAIERGLDHTGSVPASALDRGQPRRATKGDFGASALADEERVDIRVNRTEFGLDLGSESSLDALRSLWMTVKAQHGAALEDLRPLVTIRSDQAGKVELRLVAGPISNAATAARLCAVIGATGRACRPAPFEGQRLALR